MSGKSYSRALDEILLPLGFQRAGRFEWIREMDGCRDLVFLQVVSHLGITASVHFTDDNTWALLKQAMPEISGPFLVNERLGSLMGQKFDKWWKNDPSGPTELAADIATYGLPVLDSLRSLETQAERCGPADRDVWRSSFSQIWLAMTLYRMCRRDEARRVINAPAKPLNDVWRERLEAVRLWINKKTAGLSGPAA